MINWAGCVTFLVGLSRRALLINPANHIMSYRGVFTALNAKWATGCAQSSVKFPRRRQRCCNILIERRTLPVDDVDQASCPYVLIQRYRDPPAAPSASDYALASAAIARAIMPAFELYRKNHPRCPGRITDRHQDGCPMKFVGRTIHGRRRWRRR